MPICAEIKCKPPHKSIARPLVRRLARANMELGSEDPDQSLCNFSYCNNTDLNVIISLMNNLTDRHFPKNKVKSQTIQNIQKSMDYSGDPRLCARYTGLAKKKLHP